MRRRGASSTASGVAVPPPALLPCGISSVLILLRGKQLKTADTTKRASLPVFRGFSMAFLVHIGCPVGRGWWGLLVLMLQMGGRRLIGG